MFITRTVLLPYNFKLRNEGVNVFYMCYHLMLSSQIITSPCLGTSYVHSFLCAFDILGILHVETPQLASYHRLVH